MSFVVTTGNKQYLVKNGQVLIVDKIDAEVDSTIELPVIHTTGEPKTPKTVKATVLNHQKGEKIRVVKYKSKSRYHRQYGYRPHETVLKIEGVFESGKVSEQTAQSKSPKKTTATESKSATKPVAKKTTKSVTKKATAKKAVTKKATK